ncbi:MAG TPA: alpha/beta fold hydrolase [Candidatus Dormibacteraeota bacterium]|nr:alpha/beta fold hydrolase [Candidatus Dormibacteraeota bacterium]
MSAVARQPPRVSANLEPHYAEVGKARVFHYDVGQGVPVLLVHGFNHHAEAWIRNVDALVAGGFRVVALDLPGFGRSGVPRMKYSLVGYSKFLLAFMEAVQIERAHLVGHSMGGAIVLKTAIEAPRRVISVTGVDPAGMFSSVPRTWALAGHPVVRAALRPLMGRRRLLEWSHARAYHDPSLSSARQVDVMAEAYTQPGYKDHILGMAETMLLNPDGGLLWDDLPRLKRPALIVWGRQDRTLPLQHAYRAAHRVPAAELRIYDDCGHISMYEQAGAFNHDLLEFISRVD